MLLLNIVLKCEECVHHSLLVLPSGDTTLSQVFVVGRICVFVCFFVCLVRLSENGRRLTAIVVNRSE